MEALLLAMTLAAFRPCGYELLPDGNTRQVLAPNLQITYVNPLHVVEVLEIVPPYVEGVEHEASCSALVLIHGRSRMVVGNADEVRLKLRAARYDVNVTEDIERHDERRNDDD